MSRCKHENAEHMMPGDCSTPDWCIAPFMAECEQFRCIDCGAWLSLGPANDTREAVQVEIEAAHLGVDDLPRVGCHYCGRAACRYDLHESPDALCDQFDFDAGYLAECIVEHDEDQHIATLNPASGASRTGECTHFGPQAGAEWRTADGDLTTRSDPNARILACMWCGEALSFGPANDSPEALVELRAAEVIATRVNARGRLGAEDLAEWDDVIGGWLANVDDVYDFRAITSPEYQAGWLARAIATHDTHAGASRDGGK